MSKEKINSEDLFKTIMNQIESNKITPEEASSVCLLVFSAISISSKFPIELTIQAAEHAIKLAYGAEKDG